MSDKCDSVMSDSEKCDSVMSDSEKCDSVRSDKHDSVMSDSVTKWRYCDLFCAFLCL